MRAAQKKLRRTAVNKSIEKEEVFITCSFLISMLILVRVFLGENVRREGHCDESVCRYGYWINKTK
jgi:hypothetical protein